MKPHAEKHFRTEYKLMYLFPTHPCHLFKVCPDSESVELKKHPS